MDGPREEVEVNETRPGAHVLPRPGNGGCWTSSDITVMGFMITKQGH